MAPPHKRRRLMSTASSPSPSHEYSPSPTLSHTVEQLAANPSLALIPRPTPQRVDEVHLQIQKRSVGERHERRHHHQAVRRQGTAVLPALDSTLTVTVLEWADVVGNIALSTINDDLGGTYATTQTLTLVSSPLPTATPTSTSSEDVESASGTDESSTEDSSTDGSSTDGSSTDESSESTPSGTPSDGFIDSSPSAGTGVSSTTTAQPSGTGSSPSSISPTSAAVSAGSLTSTPGGGNSTRTDTTQSTNASASASSSRTSQTSLGAGVFLATLSDGDVVTITRSDEPFTTTFADGRVSTIAPSSSRNSSDNNDDGDSSRQTTRTSDTSSDDSKTAAEQQSTATSVAVITGPNATQGAPASPTVNPTTSASPEIAAGNNSGGSPPAPPGTIAGGVVGGCAGLAVILVVALVLLRWWKRKAQNGHHALPPNPSSEFSPDPDVMSSTRGQPGMAERAGLRPLVGAVPAFLRHTNRSREVAPPPSEQGFTRVSGRKLPSQFSAGMSSASPPPPDMAYGASAVAARSPGHNDPANDDDHERNLSATSFYRDSDGFYGGEGIPTTHNRRLDPTACGPFASSGGGGHSPSPSESLQEPTPEEELAAAQMRLAEGPRRTPTVHKGGPYALSPSSTVPGSPAVPSSGVGSPLMGRFSPGAEGRGGYGGVRSETPTSVAGTGTGSERGSRFTEEV